MANTHETITDIIAEKRRWADKIERDCAEKMKRGEMISDYYTRKVVADIRREADRLEAAYRHEKAAIEADALAVGGIVGASHVREMSKNASKNRADFGQLGDCAKLREAVERVLDWLKRMNAQPLNTLTISELTPSYAVNRTAKSIIENNNYHISQLAAALSASPRNCDVYNNESCRMAYHLHGDGLMTMQAFADWLFAPATKTEGGAK